MRRALGDRYRIERELGTGGMAVVYLATDLRQNRTVALKVLRPELASLIGPERFLREIEISGKLNHPHILPLFDAGDADGLPYFVMPFIAGESLRDRLSREGQLPVPDALQITREVADALSYAHTQGFIHRDIKPENIMLSSGHALVADFGIARAVTAAGGGDKLTGTGMAIGTVDYMSPEQATGSSQVDGRSDLYSLACVLYEMLVGGPPFRANTAQAVMARHLVDPVPPIRTVRSTVPIPVEAAILAAMAKSKADRFANVKEFVEALDGKRPSPSQPYPAAAAPRAALWKRLAIGGGIATALLLTYFLSKGSSAKGGAEISATAGRALDSNLVAVAPFDILDSGRESWREGLAEILSVNLDGAGPLRTVPLDAVLKEWKGRADRASAENLGRDHGARLVIFGRGVPAGSDSVRLNLTLLDVVSGQVGPEIEVRDLGSRLDLIADSATARILDNLNQVRAVGAVRSGGLGSTSWPAKKAYLRGEEFYRRHSWDSAEVYYQQAVKIDSTFALAWRKWGWARLNHVPEADSLAAAYSLRAGAFNHGLSPRDSLLVAADSLYATGQGRDPEHTAHLRRLHATLEESTSRYPGDVEAWYQLARARFYAPLLSMTLDSTLLAFQRAVALDSGFAQLLGWQGLVGIALRLDSLGVAEHYLRAAARNAVKDQQDGIRFAADVLASPVSSLRRLPQWMERASGGSLKAAAGVLGDWPDSAETGIRLARAIVARKIDPPDTLEAQDRAGILEGALAVRGHLREAAAIHGWGFFWSGEYILVGGLPPDAPLVERLRLLPWWARRHDTAPLLAQLDSADTAVRLGNGPGSPTHRIWRAARVRAYLALAKGDTSEAIRRFIPVIDSLCYGCSFTATYVDIFTAAPLLLARGRYREAARWLDYYPLTVPHPVYDMMFALWRGQAAEHLGQLQKAASAYRFFARSWVHADPQLQGFVSEAVAGLRRVGGGAVW
ncbi:MAG TPA: serine/threonine-protein kinase [Gemmatimonadales bacterium]|nr:serine/threonine-protein kinase [Gemmatimonadales bacterium]